MFGVPRLIVGASVVVLILGILIASTGGDTSYTRDEVVEASAEQEYELTHLDGGGWTGYAPLADSPNGIFLFPRPVESAPFYVFVARNDLLAREFFAPLARAGGPGVFDRLEGNVVVSSDASLTATGLSAEERRRIDAALRTLAEG